MYRKISQKWIWIADLPLPCLFAGGSFPPYVSHPLVFHLPRWKVSSIHSAVLHLGVIYNYIYICVALLMTTSDSENCMIFSTHTPAGSSSLKFAVLGYHSFLDTGVTLTTTATGLGLTLFWGGWSGSKGDFQTAKLVDTSTYVCWCKTTFKHQWNITRNGLKWWFNRDRDLAKGSEIPHPDSEHA